MTSKEKLKDGRNVTSCCLFRCVRGGRQGGWWRDEAEERRKLERGENSIRESEMKEMWGKLELLTRNDRISGRGSLVVNSNTALRTVMRL